jgi:hypothetical protein
MKLIKLTKGQFAKVDSQDFEYLNQYKWYVISCRSTKSFRAVRSSLVSEGKQKTTISMSRQIMNCPKDKLVDHINFDTLDNQRSNLRICTESQNQIHSRKPITNKSGYKGVFWYKRDKKWQVQIKFNHEAIYLGYYTNIKKAALVYNQKAIELFGEFAYLNKI